MEMQAQCPDASEPSTGGRQKQVGYEKFYTATTKYLLIAPPKQPLANDLLPTPADEQPIPNVSWRHVVPNDLGENFDFGAYSIKAHFDVKNRQIQKSRTARMIHSSAPPKSVLRCRILRNNPSSTSSRKCIYAGPGSLHNSTLQLGLLSLPKARALHAAKMSKAMQTARSSSTILRREVSIQIASLQAWQSESRQSEAALKDLDSILRNSADPNVLEMNQYAQSLLMKCKDYLKSFARGGSRQAWENANICFSEAAKSSSLVTRWGEKVLPAPVSVFSVLFSSSSDKVVAGKCLLPAWHSWPVFKFSAAARSQKRSEIAAHALLRVDTMVEKQAQVLRGLYEGIHLYNSISSCTVASGRSGLVTVTFGSPEIFDSSSVELPFIEIADLRARRNGRSAARYAYM